MRIRLALTLAALSATLAACSAETPAPSPAETGAAPPAEATAPREAGGSGPAGEVAAESRRPAEAAATEVAEKPALPEGVDEVWAPYYAHIPFVFGGDAGQAQARETGKPMMMFYTATW